MKKIILLIYLLCLTMPAFAETRIVAISCKAVIVEKPKGTNTITGFKYSLYTGTGSEETKNVDIENLIPKIKNVAWAGSVIYVCVFSDYSLNNQTLKSLITAIENNPYMEIAYIENGNEKNKWAGQIKKQYGL